MDVVSWLLDSDPALRWQVMRDLTGASPDDVARERTRVGAEGWGARLLAEQGADGRWDGGVYRPGWVREDRPFFDAWTATHFSLQSLREFGLDPDGEPARRAISLVRAHVRWSDGAPYFDGETEPCVNGIALASGAYFGAPVDGIVRTILAGQRADGGWNCDDDSAVSSFHSTICVIEGLAEYGDGMPHSRAAAVARRAGEDYLLERGLYRRRGDGTVPDPRIAMLSFPVRWFHDVLRGLEHFRAVHRRDDRLADAIALLRAKAGADGRFVLENTHEGARLFEMDGEWEGTPSRWVTLRALRVLRWWDAG